MTKRKDTTAVIDYETAQRLIGEFKFLCEFRDDYFYEQSYMEHTPLYKDVLITAVISILETLEDVLDSLFEAFPSEFMHASNKPLSRKMTKREMKTLRGYLEND